MKATHRFNGEAHPEFVCCWQNRRDALMPDWVAENFTRLCTNSMVLSALYQKGQHVNEGEWVVSTGDKAFVLSDGEFNDCFTAL